MSMLSKSLPENENVLTCQHVYFSTYYWTAQRKSELLCLHILRTSCRPYKYTCLLALQRYKTKHFKPTVRPTSFLGSEIDTPPGIREYERFSLLVLVVACGKMFARIVRCYETLKCVPYFRGLKSTVTSCG
jgi:hypothetical protein